MGIGFALLLWGLLGVLIATIGSAILLFLVRFLSRGAVRGRSFLSIAAAVFPFVCLAWAAGLFVFQGVVNEGLLHRDAGIGDSWRCPLQNGYVLLMIDVTETGWVYRPATQRVPFAVSSQPDSADGITALQIAGPYIFAARDSRGTAAYYAGDPKPDTFLTIDTRRGAIEYLATEDALRASAQSLGYRLDLKPIQQVYSKYRFTWFDIFVGGLFVLPPLAGFILLMRWARRMRVKALLPASAQFFRTGRNRSNGNLHVI